MNEERQSRPCLVASDGSNWDVFFGDGPYLQLSIDDASLLPALSEEWRVEQIYWPIEGLLVRVFHLPLSDPRYLDAEILNQEICEQTGESPGDWWLAWQAMKVNDGVAGIAFGLPEELRLAIESDEQWRLIPHIRVDAWERLNMRLRECMHAAEHEAFESAAVFDADANGVCFGFWSGSRWLGVRRLNWTADIGDEDVAEQIRLSLQAMGWENRQEDAAIGRLGESLLASLGLERWLGETLADTALPERVAATCACSSDQATTLDFRRGSWMIHSTYAWQPWRRTAILAAVGFAAWMVSVMFHTYMLSSRADQYRHQIEAAFHQGLPNEHVMIDPLAQLRKATGGGGGSSGGAGHLLQEIDFIRQVYAKTPWEMLELDYSDTGIELSGNAKDLQRVNQIRDALQQAAGTEVQLTDTNLTKGGHVDFRMHWQ